MSTKTMILTGALALACTAFASDESDTFAMFIHPEQCSLWHTAGTSFTVPIPYPDGATTATLTVSGEQYAGQVISDITDDEQALTLPAATSPAAENTYTLTLDFDKGDSVSAVVSVISGFQAGGDTGATRCLSTEIGTWNRMPPPRTTLPVPYGTTSLTYNGSEIDTNLNGDQGFCTVPSQAGTYVLTVDGEAYEAALEPSKGLVIVVQ